MAYKVPAALFRVVDGVIGSLQQRSVISPVIRQDSDADADSDGKLCNRLGFD
jgi:hypothetical protein